MAATVDYDALRTDWALFFELLGNERGIRLRLNMPDTLVLRRGEPLCWFATNKDGYVVQRPAGRASMDDVRCHLLSCALDEGGRYPPHVAIMRGPDGLPKLLTRQALDALCERLAAADAGGDSGLVAADVPCVLQAYVAPFLDLRYVTSYTNDGAATSCHTFQRRFSRRYLPFRDPTAAPPQPGVLVGSAAAETEPSQAGGDASSAGSDGASAGGAAEPAAEPGEEAAAAAGPAAEQAAAAADASGGSADAAAAPAHVASASQGPEAYASLEGGEQDGSLLDDAALADSERLLARTLGPVDPSIKMAARKAAHSLVQYVQKAHLLTLRGLVCEFARDSAGHLWFLGPVRADWASLIPGRGGEPWANANLTQQPRDEESWPSTAGEEAVAGPQAAVAAALQAQQGGQAPAALACQLPGSPSQAQGHVRQVACGGSLAGPAAECSSKADVERCLPAPALRTGKGKQGPGSPGFAASAAPEACLPGLGRQASPGPVQLCGPQQAQQAQQGQGQLPLRTPKVVSRYSPGQTGSASRERLLVTAGGGSPGAWQQQGLGHASSPTATGLAGFGRTCQPGSPPLRGQPVLTTHLTKELESLRDELIVRSDLAEALASKVEALEHDKHVITGAFEQVLGGMQADLADVKARLEALRRERDGLAAQLAEASQRLASAEAEREELRSMLDAERGTAFTSMGQLQKQQEDAGVRAARAEAELRSLQERFREEQAACDALKKLMVFYQHSTGDSGGALGGPPGAEGGKAAVLRALERPELKYAETLQEVDELLMREGDPSGERYALSKVLHTCQGDLHSIFLHYSLLDAGFARFWPPQLTLTGWLAFMKDIGSTNLVPGVRTRSDNTMHVQEATEVFRRYCLRQAVMRGPGAAVQGPATTARGSGMARSPSSAALGEMGPGAGGEQAPARPPSSQSTASAAPTSRPFSAASSSAALAGATMSFQSFCAALVYVAAKVARGSSEMAEALPFLSEQTRAFIEAIVPKAQRVTSLAPAGKMKGGASSSPAGKGASASGAGGLGAKEAAAKEAAAKLPKLKKAAQPKTAPPAAVVVGAEMSAIAERSREGSAAEGLGSSSG